MSCYRRFDLERPFNVEINMVKFYPLYGTNDQSYTYMYAIIQQAGLI